MKPLQAHKEETGTAIILVISILATLMVIVGIAAEYSGSIRRNVERSNTLENAIAIADGCLEYSFAHWRQLCKTPGNPIPTTNELSALPLPTQLEFPAVPNFTATANDYSETATETVQQIKVVAVDPQEVATAGNAYPPPGIGSQAANATYNYRASAYVTLPSVGKSKIVAKVERIFQEQQLSPWNYAIFYNDPLEIHPGPDYNITGWVHTNSDLYTAHDTLHFMDKATFAGKWAIDFMPGDGQHDYPPNPAPTAPTWPMNPEIRPDFDSSHLPFNLDPVSFDPSDPPANPNNTGYHELIEPPDLGYPDPLQGVRYYDQADVIIEVRNNPNPALPDIVTVTGKNEDVEAMFSAPGVIKTNEDIQDNREANPNVRLTTLDVSKLITNDLSSPNGVKWNVPDQSSFKGIVYIYNTSADAKGIGAKRGVRLTNGTRIPDRGLTVASLNPVYIQGNFNTGGVDPPSNSGDPTKPEVSGYIREPCSVIADAVNVLSSSWVDTLSGTMQKATNTTVNTAIASGIVSSGSDPTGKNYSGGAENFPRFLENWSGRTLTYYGSMVELYRSQQAIGSWKYGSPIYNAPARKWYFDTLFKLNKPPGTLMTYTYVKGRWSIVQ
jgi:hypothetical protein